MRNILVMPLVAGLAGCASLNADLPTQAALVKSLRAARSGKARGAFRSGMDIVDTHGVGRLLDHKTAGRLPLLAGRHTGSQVPVGAGARQASGQGDRVAASGLCEGSGFRYCRRGSGDRLIKAGRAREGSGVAKDVLVLSPGLFTGYGDNCRAICDPEKQNANPQGLAFS